jgi:hypothetical protein
VVIDVPVAGVILSEIQHFRADLRCFLGSRRRETRESAATGEKLRDRSQRASAENRLNRRLTNVPIPRPQQPDGAVHRIHSSPTSFVEQGLEQSRALRFGYGGDEGHKTGAAEELSDEDGGVALSFGGFDPLDTWTEDAILAAAFSKDATAIATHDIRFFS